MRQREFQNKNSRGNMVRGDSAREDYPQSRFNKKKNKDPQEYVSALELFKQELKEANPEELDIEDYSVFSHPIMSSK